MRSEDGFMTFCIYDAPSAERAREHAQAAELPANAVYAILTDIHPGEL